MARLARKIVAITGASAGIGRATADSRGRRGRDGRAARRVGPIGSTRSSPEIRAAGGMALAVAGDVTSATDMESLVARAVEAFGRLDVMVCNAGIGYHGPLDETPPDVLRRLVDVNLMGTLYAARAALVGDAAAGTRPHHRGVVDRRPPRRRRLERLLGDEGRADRIHRGSARGVRRHGTPRVGRSIRCRRLTEFHDAIARDFGHAVEGKGPRQSADTRGAGDRRAAWSSPRAEVYPLRLRVVARRCLERGRPGPGGSIRPAVRTAPAPRTGSAEPGDR